MSNKAQKRPNS